MQKQENVIKTKDQWVRNCPNCNKEIKYQTKVGFINCTKQNTFCKTCKGTKTKIVRENLFLRSIQKIEKDSILYYIRECPKCNQKIEHLNKYSCIKGIKQNKKCNKCSRQERNRIKK